MKRVFSLVVLVAAGLAQAFEPIAEPVLRLDPGSHSERINAVAADPLGRWVATASSDKTLRLWSTKDGKAVATLRAPIGAGSDGRLDAVAFSPDGTRVATAGFTQFNDGRFIIADDGMTVYVFDAAGGTLVRRLTNVPYPVRRLEFSADGRWIALALGGTGGVQVYNAATGRLMAEDAPHGAQTNGLHFARDGRLAVTGDDGLLRLYRLDGQTLVLMDKQALQGGKRPQAVRFSPDGLRIAMGFRDTPAVALVEAGNLAQQTAARTAPSARSSLDQVAWSADGSTLFAAGTEWANGRYLVRRWPAGGLGEPLDSTATVGRISDLATLPDGRVAYASVNREWGVMDPTGSRPLQQPDPAAQMRQVGDGLRLSASAQQVRFGMDAGGRTPVAFDTTRGAFMPPDAPGLLAPTLSAPELAVTDWQDGQAPKLNGVPLKAEGIGLSRSLAFRPGGEGFVLGTDFRLLAYGPDGSLRWSVPTPATAAGVNASANGRWIVAAYDDGSLRWHRASDGAEQLALFADRARSRWILWTPGGYYQASPGGEHLLGWHLNRGRTRSGDFVPVAMLQKTFARPDVVQAVLDTGSEAAALERAGVTAANVSQILPPFVRIVGPREIGFRSAGTYALRVEVRTTADAPASALQVKVNGQAVAVAEAPAPGAEPFREIQVPVPAENASIEVVAGNRHGASAAVLRMIWVNP